MSCKVFQLVIKEKMNSQSTSNGIDESALVDLQQQPAKSSLFSTSIQTATTSDSPVQGDSIQSASQSVRMDSTQTSGPAALYTVERVLGRGSFGTVFLARIIESGELVAIKKVLQDPRFKNRELQLMTAMNQHPNIVALRQHYTTTGEEGEVVYLNLVLEYLPETLSRFLRVYKKGCEYAPLMYVKVFAFQLLRCLGYLHQQRITHRDIKPQNLLIDPNTGVLKVCDFGSAKKLVTTEKNVAYICSRYYRAPELILGNVNYTPAIDIWSAGCVLAEMLTGQPLFQGETGVDQFVEIMKILGSPNPDDVDGMNPNYVDFNFPQVHGIPLRRVFRSHVPPDVIELVQKMLVYNPRERATAWECCAHPWFEELRLENSRLPNGCPLPPLFNFFQTEIESMPGYVRSILLGRSEK